MKEDDLMIKVYGMPSCPDCSFVETQIKDNADYQFVDIGAHVRNMKEFTKLRDSNAAFDDVRGTGAIGIPCFVLEDGTVTRKPEDAGLKSKKEEKEAGAACRIDGTGC